MKAIKAGIITDSTKKELEIAEHRKEQLQNQLKTITSKPDAIIPRAREVYQRMVKSLSTM